MAILQNATFQGTPHNEVRPGSGVRKSTVERWLKDQAAVYEGIVGEKVPNASAIAATPHVHDGVNGALIRLPLFSGVYRMDLHAREEALFDSGLSHEGFYPVDWRPFYAPKGVSKILVLVVAAGETNRSLRVTIQDSSFATVGQALGVGQAFLAPWFQPLGSEDEVWAFPVEVNPGEVNLFKLEAWDGFYDVGQAVGFAFDETEESRRRLPDGRRISGVVGIPVEREPVQVPAGTRPSLTDNVRVKVPATFTSFDGHLVQNTRALSSYVLVRALQNDALLYERLTGRPAGARSSLTVQGHTNDGDDSHDIDHALGSWGYGVLRPSSMFVGQNAPDAMFQDAPAGDDTFRLTEAWSGVPSAPYIDMASGSTDTDYDAFIHRVRVPQLAAANRAHSTGKLKFSALVWDGGVGLTIKAALGLFQGGSWDTEANVTASGFGRELVTISGLECVNGGALNALRIRVRYASTKQGALGLYGSCLYYES